MRSPCGVRMSIPLPLPPSAWHLSQPTRLATRASSTGSPVAVSAAVAATAGTVENLAAPDIRRDRQQHEQQQVAHRRSSSSWEVNAARRPGGPSVLRPADLRLAQAPVARHRGDRLPHLQRIDGRGDVVHAQQHRPSALRGDQVRGHRPMDARARDRRGWSVRDRPLARQPGQHRHAEFGEALQLRQQRRSQLARSAEPEAWSTTMRVRGMPGYLDGERARRGSDAPRRPPRRRNLVACMPRGSPRMRISTTGTPSAAAASSAPSRRSANTSLIILAPAATAARITSGFEAEPTGSRAGATAPRPPGSCAAVLLDGTPPAPGRVDLPPTSRMSAPAARAGPLRDRRAGVEVRRRRRIRRHVDDAHHLRDGRAAVLRPPQSRGLPPCRTCRLPMRGRRPAAPRDCAYVRRNGRSAHRLPDASAGVTPCLRLAAYVPSRSTVPLTFLTDGIAAPPSDAPCRSIEAPWPS